MITDCTINCIFRLVYIPYIDLLERLLYYIVSVHLGLLSGLWLFRIWKSIKLVYFFGKKGKRQFNMNNNEN